MTEARREKERARPWRTRFPLAAELAPLVGFLLFFVPMWPPLLSAWYACAHVPPTRPAASIVAALVFLRARPWAVPVVWLAVAGCEHEGWIPRSRALALAVAWGCLAVLATALVVLAQPLAAGVPCR